MISAGTYFAGLKGQYRHFLDRFVPVAIHEDREAHNRALMFLVSHTIGPVLGNTVPLALWLVDPTPSRDVAILAVSISLFWIFPALLRRGVRYSRLVVFSVANLNFCILWSCYHYGGIASPTLPWVLTIPILSLFYIGGERRLQPHLLLITGISFLVFVLSIFLFPPLPSDISSAAMHGLGAVSTAATLCYVATMAIYYARIFDAGVDLEVEVQRRQQMTEELREAIIATDRSSAAKAEFLARMSHEIKTPLNAIIGYSELLHEQAIDAEDKDLKGDLGRILEAGYYLIRLVNMILDLSKIEAEKMMFKVQRHVLRDVFELAIAARRKEIDTGRIDFSITVSPAVETIEADKTRVLQVIDSILENAVQHSVGGSINLVGFEGLVGEQPVICLAVSDTGRGIPPNILSTLFNPFSTSREASDGRYGGTGLSLAVSSRLCKAMGGTLLVESTLGQGSTFTLCLPKQPSSELLVEQTLYNRAA